MLRALAAILAAAAMLVCGAEAVAASPSALPAASAQQTQTASLGPITATLTFRDASGSDAPMPYTDLALQITDGARTLRSGPLDTHACGQACSPDHVGHGDSVHVVDMNGDGVTEVLVDLYTGGAHCCSVDEIFSIDPATGALTQAERNWGDPGAELADLGHDGKLEFLTADDRFAYRFDAFAFSGLPVLVERFANGTFTDVTSSYRALVTRDASTWLHAYRHNWAHGNGLGFLAAWAADEYRLNRRSAVDRFLSRELHRGHLRGDGAYWHGGARYVHDLKRFLARSGYAR